MNIFQIIAENLSHGPSSIRFPGKSPEPPGFRGAVQLDPALCTGCAACVYVCTSKAIQVTSSGPCYDWAYDPGRCTFCGRCVEICPSHGLQMEASRLAVYTRVGSLSVQHHLSYPLCVECGRSAYPINEVILARAFSEVSDEIRAWSRLCNSCRQKRCQPSLVEGVFKGETKWN